MTITLEMFIAMTILEYKDKKCHQFSLINFISYSLWCVQSDEGDREHEHADQAGSGDLEVSEEKNNG